MASFRILDPLQVFFNLNGSAPASGGYVRFFEAGTSDPKSVFADPALTINNGPRVNLDAAGRPLVDAWGDGAYKLRLFDKNDTLIKETDYVQAPGGAAAQIPPLVANAFLTNDGGVLLWELLTLIPDVAGQLGKVLSNDGTALLWKEFTIPTPVAPDIVLSGDGASGKIQLGTSAVARKAVILWGSDSMPASGQTAASGNFNFKLGADAFSFDEPPFVLPMCRSASVTAEGQVPVFAQVGATASGFSVGMHTDDFGRNGSRITSAVPFGWIAFGFKTVPATP
ncbi:hypothetical protein ACI2IY_05635 [Lysobacter enzymogenes]|uniref:hypothetical protein n=1 Tax=Lysobacter enzymogenes TaxID=69 RepID=UPI00384FF3AC